MRRFFPLGPRSRRGGGSIGIGVGILITNGGRFDHCRKLSEIYYSPYLSPHSGIRHLVPHFRLLSTYTRPPYLGATSSSPQSLHHLCTFAFLAPMRESIRHLTACAHSRCLRSYTSPANKPCYIICAHSRCLRPFANPCTSSLPACILVACAHTPHSHINHRGTSWPGVFHLTRGSFTRLITQTTICHGGFTCLESFT